MSDPADVTLLLMSTVLFAGVLTGNAKAASVGSRRRSVPHRGRSSRPDCGGSVAGSTFARWAGWQLDCPGRRPRRCGRCGHGVRAACEQQRQHLVGRRISQRAPRGHRRSVRGRRSPSSTRAAARLRSRRRSRLETSCGAGAPRGVWCGVRGSLRAHGRGCARLAPVVHTAILTPSPRGHLRRGDQALRGLLLQRWGTRGGGS